MVVAIDVTWLMMLAGVCLLSCCLGWLQRALGHGIVCTRSLYEFTYYISPKVAAYCWLVPDE